MFFFIADVKPIKAKNNNYKYITLEEEQRLKKESKEKWDRRFLDLAKHYAEWSKDDSTKVGCVIVGRDKVVVSSGYNGLPRGADDNKSVRISRPEKYFWFEHAERNAIYNAARRGTALSGTTLYSTLCPCMDCARGIVQSGIKRVVTADVMDDRIQAIWREQFPRVEELFAECGVSIDFI